MTTTAQIMNEMDRTRDEIRTTLGAITERASIERVVQEYVMPTKSSAMEFARAFADAVRANPLPIGITAVGLGWLMLGQRYRPLTYRDGPAGTDIGEAGAGQRAREGVEEARRHMSEKAEEAKRRVGETAEEAKRRVGETVDKAKNLAEETVHRVRDAAGKGRHWTAETAGHASDTIRRSVDSAYGATRETASRVRQVAERPVGYAREHPLALGAVLVVVGAALALLLARRTVTETKEEDLAPAGMPETPYASGTQAGMGGPHRNPTEPLTPEEEEPVFAGGDVSAEAIHPASETSDAEREVVATPPFPSQETGGSGVRPKETETSGG